jgi:hypothetical protein
MLFLFFQWHSVAEITCVVANFKTTGNCQSQHARTRTHAHTPISERRTLFNLGIRLCHLGVSCTVFVLTCFKMCGCFGNVCVLTTVWLFW